MNFEPGDRVRIVRSPYDSVKVGTIGRVERVSKAKSGRHYLVIVDGPTHQAFWNYELMLIEDEGE